MSSVRVEWENFKNLFLKGNSEVYYIYYSDFNYYMIWNNLCGQIIECKISNSSEISDFETNYKSLCNLKKINSYIENFQEVSHRLSEEDYTLFYDYSLSNKYIISNIMVKFNSAHIIRLQLDNVSIFDNLNIDSYLSLNSPITTPNFTINSTFGGFSIDFNLNIPSTNIKIGVKSRHGLPTIKSFCFIVCYRQGE